MRRLTVITDEDICRSDNRSQILLNFITIFSIIDIRKWLQMNEFCFILTIRSSLRPLLSTNHVEIPVAMTWKRKLITRTEFTIIIFTWNMIRSLGFIMQTWTAPSPTVAASLDEIPVTIHKSNTRSGAVQILEVLHRSSNITNLEDIRLAWW